MIYIIKQKITQNVIYRISLNEKYRKTKYFKMYLFKSSISFVKTFFFQKNNLRI